MNPLELLWGEAFFAGALAQLLARLSRLPSVVLLLAVGLLIGRAGLDLVNPELLGRGLEPVVGLLVSLVRVDGGLTLRDQRGQLGALGHGQVDALRRVTHVLWRAAGAIE